MIIISYDFEDDLIRSRFQRMLTKNGAIRLQYSVYEINNTKRILENIKTKIIEFSRNFNTMDSIIIFEVEQDCITKYGSAVHRDTDIVFFD